MPLRESVSQSSPSIDWHRDSRRLNFKFPAQRAVAGFVRNGLFILLGAPCLLALAVIAAPKSKPKPPPAHDPPRLDAASQLPDEVWKRLPLAATQKRQLTSLQARLQRSQSFGIRQISGKADVLRQQLRIAEATPGQQARAAKLRAEILRLSAPLQEQRATFVRDARSLLTPGQTQELETLKAQVQAEQRQRAGGRTHTAGQGGGRRAGSFVLHWPA